MSNLLDRPLRRVLQDLGSCLLVGAFLGVLFWVFGRFLVYLLGGLLQTVGGIVAGLGTRLIELVEWSNRLRGNGELYAMATVGLVFAGILFLLTLRKVE